MDSISSVVETCHQPCMAVSVQCDQYLIDQWKVSGPTFSFPLRESWAVLCGSTERPVEMYRRSWDNDGKFPHVMR